MYSKFLAYLWQSARVEAEIGGATGPHSPAVLIEIGEISFSIFQAGWIERVDLGCCCSNDPDLKEGPTGNTARQSIAVPDFPATIVLELFHVAAEIEVIVFQHS